MLLVLVRNVSDLFMLVLVRSFCTFILLVLLMNCTLLMLHLVRSISYTLDAIVRISTPDASFIKEILLHSSYWLSEEFLLHSSC